MSKLFAVWFFVFILAACATTKQGGNQFERTGPGYQKLNALVDEYLETKSFNFSLAGEAESLFKVENHTLGLADLAYWRGVYHAFSMKADNTDYENLAKSTGYLNEAQALYRSLGEDWLQAKAGYFLIYSYARAARWNEACLAYDETLDRLASAKGKFQDFIILNQDFTDAPAKLVYGNYGHNCYLTAKAAGREPRDPPPGVDPY